MAMDNIRIDASERSPEVDFNFGENVFTLRGESYPEDVTAFYGPILENLETHLGDQSGATIHFNFERIYFNSSTAKVLMGLFETLDGAAEAGNDVVIAWAYEQDDDNMEELGEDFSEDLEHATFEMKVLDS